jgi:hypothetical protein
LARRANIVTSAAYLLAAFAVQDLFLGTALGVLALGSGLYHWRPTKDNLAADRFGMLLVFSHLLALDEPWYAQIAIVAACVYVAATGAAASPTLIIVGALVVATRDTLISAALGTALIAWAYWLWLQDPEDYWWAGGRPHHTPLHALWHVVTAIAIVVLAWGGPA